MKQNQLFQKGFSGLLSRNSLRPYAPGDHFYKRIILEQGSSPLTRPPARERGRMANCPVPTRRVRISSNHHWRPKRSVTVSPFSQYTDRQDAPFWQKAGGGGGLSKMRCSDGKLIKAFWRLTAGRDASHRNLPRNFIQIPLLVVSLKEILHLQKNKAKSFSTISSSCIMYLLILDHSQLLVDLNDYKRPGPADSTKHLWWRP